MRALGAPRAARSNGPSGYRLTETGEALRPVIEQMGLWAQRHLKKRNVTDDDLDDKLLMWSLRRSARLAKRSWWLVTADLRAFTEVVLGRRSLQAALREGCVRLQGPAALARWLPLNGEAMHGMGLLR